MSETGPCASFWDFWNSMKNERNWSLRFFFLIHWKLSGKCEKLALKWEKKVPVLLLRIFKNWMKNARNWSLRFFSWFLKLNKTCEEISLKLRKINPPPPSTVLFFYFFKLNEKGEKLVPALFLGFLKFNETWEKLAPRWKKLRPGASFWDS